MNNGQLIKGIIAGAAIGAVVAILLAPESGYATRENLSEKGNDLVDGVKSKLKTLFGHVADRLLEDLSGSLTRTKSTASQFN